MRGKYGYAGFKFQEIGDKISDKPLFRMDINKPPNTRICWGFRLIKTLK